MQGQRLLEWYTHMGADELIGEVPINRTIAHARPPIESPIILPPKLSLGEINNLGDLRQALLAFDGCSLRQGANQLVFADGDPEARIMFVGEAPSAEEDRLGLPFMGQEGRLLEKMLAAIGLKRENIYLSNIVPWRPPGNRPPNAREVAALLPFIERQIELVDPEILVLLGQTAAQAILAKNESIGRLRGGWHEYATPGLSRPLAAIATFHPTYLLNTPSRKREVWQDFLQIKHKLFSQLSH